MLEDRYLTDEQINQAIQEAYSRPDLTADYVSEQDRIVAKVASDHTSKWFLDRTYMTDYKPDVVRLTVSFTREEWLALKELAEKVNETDKK